MSPGLVFLNDRLGRDGCTDLAACRREVGAFRTVGSAARTAGTNYIPMLPAELATLPPQAIDQGLFSLAVFDLDAYADFDAVMETARTSTEKRGRINREIARAQKNGYTVKPFAFALHVPDIVEIHTSKDMRDGRPIRGQFYHQSIADLGGAPTGPVESPAPACPHHHESHWGVFQREDGYRQGAVQTNEKLVGYISLLRRGDSAWYSRIMGHGDHLKHGVMYQLHYELVRALLANRPHGLRYLVFFEYARTFEDQRVRWKTLLLFKPCYLIYGEDRAMTWPDTPAPAAARQALSATIDAPWPQAVATAASLGVGAPWLELLHRAWVIERARAPGLVADLLSAGATIGRETLRQLAPNLFPMEILDGVATIAVILTGRSRGIDTLLPLFERGAKRVSVVHPDASERAALQALYDPDWTYSAETSGSADLVITESTAVPPPARRLLVSVAENALKPRTGAAAGQMMSARLSRSLTCQRIIFRYGDPSATAWLWLE